MEDIPVILFSEYSAGTTECGIDDSGASGLIGLASLSAIVLGGSLINGKKKKTTAISAVA
jgi:hypothetical protein